MRALDLWEISLNESPGADLDTEIHSDREYDRMHG